jgi:hypothetical protein
MRFFRPAEQPTLEEMGRLRRVGKCHAMTRQKQSGTQAPAQFLKNHGVR